VGSVADGGSYTWLSGVWSGQPGGTGEAADPANW